MSKNKKLLFDIRTKNSGLPAKSFMHVISLDFFIKLAVSCLEKTNFFDSYIMSLLKWKVRYKDRESNATDFLNFLCIYDERRVNELFPPHKFTNRTDLILFPRMLETAGQFFHIQFLVVV